MLPMFNLAPSLPRDVNIANHLTHVLSMVWLNLPGAAFRQRVLRLPAERRTRLIDLSLRKSPSNATSPQRSVPPEEASSLDILDDPDGVPGLEPVKMPWLFEVTFSLPASASGTQLNPSLDNRNCNSRCIYYSVCSRNRLKDGPGLRQEPAIEGQILPLFR